VAATKGSNRSSGQLFKAARRAQVRFRIHLPRLKSLDRGPLRSPTAARQRRGAETEACTAREEVARRKSRPGTDTIAQAYLRVSGKE
jgi:hypothetical protein